ncbi:Hypothetical predicted protein [Pelobates cultripes]|uniref:Uncharacterized protein n=1 Tax=Pelobates cultripes TaxID=61616 RepID=A0AAD1SG60_PELCU|nr:Hypothetical predicted protein [Pelobates cultripes]
MGPLERICFVMGAYCSPSKCGMIVQSEVWTSQDTLRDILHHSALGDAGSLSVMNRSTSSCKDDKYKVGIAVGRDLKQKMQFREQHHFSCSNATHPGHKCTPPPSNGGTRLPRRFNSLI